MPDYSPSKIKEWIDNTPLQKIKEIRQSMGMSQGVMGKLLGVSANTISRWESGLRPSFRNAEFLMLFEKFTVRYVLKKREVASCIARHGEVRTLYLILNKIYTILGEGIEDVTEQ